MVSSHYNLKQCLQQNCVYIISGCFTCETWISGGKSHQQPPEDAVWCCYALSWCIHVTVLGPQCQWGHSRLQGWVLPKEANLAVPPVPAVCHLHGCPCNQDRSDTNQGANQSSSVTSVIVCFPVPLPLFPKHEGMKRIQPEFIISVFRVEPMHHLLVWVPHSLQFSDFFLEFFPA